MDLKENTNQVFQQVTKAITEAGCEDGSVSVIAVTKYVTDARVEQAIEVGVDAFAENRPQNYLERKQKYSDKEWHLIGSLQTRKVRDVINHVDYFHALDRESLAKEIEKRAEHVINCFVQVNTSGEESKYGLTPEAALEFVKGLEKHQKIRVVGLMTMAPFLEDEATLRSCFRKLRELRDEIKGLCLEYAPCEFLSMGMSNDYEIAIEEGATHIRIGTALVGNELK